MIGTGSRKQVLRSSAGFGISQTTQETKRKKWDNQHFAILSFYTCLYCEVGNGFVTGSCDPISKRGPQQQLPTMLLCPGLLLGGRKGGCNPPEEGLICHVGTMFFSSSKGSLPSWGIWIILKSRAGSEGNYTRCCLNCPKKKQDLSQILKHFF